MEIYSYNSKELQAERIEYRREISLLEATEGWLLLTNKQRQIIRSSLYIQDRAERGMDPRHKNDPWYYDWNLGKNPYSDSMEHIKRWFCHPSAYALEGGNTSGVRPPDCPDEFFEGNYFEIRSEEELEFLIENFGFPCVVHISEEKIIYPSEKNMLHTFIALGHDDNNDLVIWEKIRIGLPYRVTTHRQVFQDYRGNNFWGIRKLR